MKTEAKNYIIGVLRSFCAQLKSAEVEILAELASSNDDVNNAGGTSGTVMVEKDSKEIMSR